ncbi:glycosyltransferase family 4 protein [Methanohalophilus sp. DAL1]|uniref:glycosyltransferase family 4 protein n=1 Tax=Methanohalophilus sp. DAL1 TaxID=1864608 RepID=UPI0008186EE4|nr:glycosyltransferase family 4 protein [Methanohalophilus sp. DAL1]OBZ34281.1 MAG: hexosyltransferase [Methanohalophilus sp. DAL1]
MKLAFIVQRYGEDIVGGAEYLTRLVAEHVNKYHEVEVLTTCAKDYHTWENVYKVGTEGINGILVRRFKNSRYRDSNKQSRIQEKVFYSTHNRDDELLWIDEQGPYCPDLLEYISKNKDNYDVFIFFTFRYYQSYYGIKEVGDKSLVASFAENDPALDLTTTNEIFKNVKGIIYSTPEEQDLICSKVNFNEKEKHWDIVGCGIEVPDNIQNFESMEDTDYIFYLGRIEGSKGCYQLFEYYKRAVEELKDIPRLVLAGYDAIGVPKNPNIEYIGFVSEEEKFSLLKNAKLLIMPSPYESLSLVTLEAMRCGTPVLVNGECEVLKGQCIRSNAGLWYQNYDEFRECMKLLLKNDDLRIKMGENGKTFVEENYSWETVEKKYLNLLEKLERK